MEDIMDIMEEFAGEFGEASLKEGDEQRFTIDSDAKAEWAIRKIAEEEAECERLTACCQAEIDRYKERQEAYAKRLEGRTANLRAMLLLYFGTVPVKETKTQQKYELPSGSLVMKKPSSDFKPDPDKLRDWLVAGKMTDYLKTEVSLKWALVKKQLSTAADGSIVFGETGEIIPEGEIQKEVNGMAYIEMVTTKKVHGPRGEYYDWCAVREDGFLIFGDEQGNYCGGEFLTPEFYPGLHDYTEHQSGIDVGRGYWHCVRKSLESWKLRDSVFYEKIMDMVKRHGITIPKEPIPEVMI